MSRLPALPPWGNGGRGYPEEGIRSFLPGHYLGGFSTPTEGFQSWMWRGLTFLLPFLFFGHVSPTGSPHPPLWCRRLWLRAPRSTALTEQTPSPFQFWQLFNALTLFNLARDPECKEWQVSPGSGGVHGRPHLALDHLDLGLPYPSSPQVLMCGLPFLLLFLGNFFTTLRVVHQKFHSQQHRSKKD